LGGGMSNKTEASEQGGGQGKAAKFGALVDFNEAYLI
jgi:hypothetical protein